MRILIVEDDADIQSFLKNRLEEKCFAVDTASDGDQGLFQAKHNEYDLILLDYSLPGKNGYEICKILRENGKHTPIIMLSVVGEVNHKINGFQFGIDDYITKPFYFDEVLARVQTVLRRPKTIEASVFKIDDLTLDCEKQKVVRGKSMIYLTRKEFSLLEYLMKNSGNVVSRGALMEHVWDVNLDPFSNTIETHILNLRRKVDKAPKKKLIHSIPGRGYKLDTAR